MKFDEDNTICYGQDLGFHVGVPGGIDFEVSEIRGNRIELIADGYGRQGCNKYGNGSISVYLQELGKKEIKEQENIQNKLDEAIDHLKVAAEILQEEKEK